MPAIPVPAMILRALAQETLERLRLATEIEHPGESGRAREQILTAFMERLIPSSFGVSTGFVVDALGGKSRQVDVVVYRTDYAPVFEIGQVKHFLIESVVAVLEVKAAIDSEADLTQALDNIASVKGLDRTNRDRNYRLMEDQVVTDMRPDWSRQGIVDPDFFLHQVFGVIVTERSLTQDSFAARYLGWLGTHPRREWPNLYVDANGFLAGYLVPKGQPDEAAQLGLDVKAPTAKKLVIYRPKGEGASPLLQLAFELVNWFRVVPKIDFKAVDYLAPGDASGDEYPLG
jgi:Domain of unknown function (DUF6602)